MGMAKASARLRDRERARTGRRRAIRSATRARKLTRRDLELPDGRYLLAYGHSDEAREGRDA
jgi:hypothetical protein